MSLRSLLRVIYYKVKWIVHLPINQLNHTHYDSSNKVAENCSLKYCTLGRYNYVGRRNSLYNVKVGNYCCLGPDIHMGGMQHSMEWYCMSPLLNDDCILEKQTIIGNDVWIGAQCVIKQGVKIGDGAVIGANSFVNKDVEPFSIVVGSPARHIKYRFKEDVREAIIKSGYWDKEPAVAKQILNNLNIL